MLYVIYLKYGRGYSQVQYLQIKTTSQVQYLQIKATSQVQLEEGGGREGGGEREQEGLGEVRREWEGELYIASVGSRAGGNNRKRARSAQRRVGPKARPTAGAPAPGSRVSASFPSCVR